MIGAQRVGSIWSGISAFPYSTECRHLRLPTSENQGPAAATGSFAAAVVQLFTPARSFAKPTASPNVRPDPRNRSAHRTHA